MSYRRKHIKPKLKKKKKFYQQPLFFIFIVFLLVVIALYFILFFSKFQISAIDISGNENIESQDIENLAWLNINRKLFSLGPIMIETKSIFTVDSKALVKNILDTFPSIQEVKIQKKLPNSITLTIQERKPFAVFCPPAQAGQNDKECFFLDESGVIFDELENIPQDMFVVRKEASNQEIFSGENIINKDTISMISKIEKELENNFQVGVKEVLISDSLVFTTSENWKIYFDPASDINSQITKMNVLLNDEIPPNIRKNLQYIYLQYKGRAYYK